MPSPNRTAPTVPSGTCRTSVPRGFGRGASQSLDISAFVAVASGERAPVRARRGDGDRGRVEKGSILRVLLNAGRGPAVGGPARTATSAAMGLQAIDLLT